MMQRGTVRRTKIISTLGPATDSAEMIGKLMDAGVNIFRLNMSHAPHDWVRRVVGDIRAESAKRARFSGILMDTQGPAIRTGDIASPLDLQPGQKFTLTVRGERDLEEHSVDVNYENFINDISVGDVVLIDNGTIQMKVLAKTAIRWNAKSSPKVNSAAGGTSICPASRSACPRSPPRTSRM